ncbi:MAG: type III-B CRISPR module-associated protein Cmr3 [Desulfonauticus sp.]|nr:type III-B CRISPR module-associated protein Cmr3 [Desulfonauticus sp.]
MVIEITPMDTLFFRDSKPFYMGEETWSDSMSLPYPSVIYGALRSVYFANNSGEIKKANTAYDPTINLNIKSICFKIGNSIYFPLPLDCIKYKDSNEKKIHTTLKLLKKEYFFSDIPLDYIVGLDNDKKIENILNGLIRQSNLKKYLNSHLLDPFVVKKLSDVIESEPKIGITRSRKTLSSDESKLYRVDMKRFKENFSIVVDFEGLNLPNTGLLKLGGEGKGALYSVNKDVVPNIDFPNFNNNETYFKLVLTTPAIFKKGWIPAWIDEETLIGNINSLKLKLLSVVMGKPIYISGFDIKNRRPKPMFKAVPHGSVYYFKLLKGTFNEIKDNFHCKSISDINNKQGFGITFVGKLNNMEN